MSMVLEIDAREAGCAERAKESVAQNGVVIIRNAFDGADIEGLLQNMEDFRAKVKNFIETGEDPEIPDYYLFNKNTTSCALLALDPGSREIYRTRGEPGGGGLNRYELMETSHLFSAMKKSRAAAIISTVTGEDALFRGARVRVVHHEGGKPNDSKGAVALHQEKWPIRKQQVPIGHNIWMLLNSDGSIANDTLPGLQFVLGKNDFWRKDLPENDQEYENKYRKTISTLNRACRLAADSKEEMIEIEDHVIYRPKLKLGDVALFDHHILHGTFVPGEASGVRLSCEFRIFPPDPNYPGLGLK